MSYLDFWWAVIMATLRPVFIGATVVIALVILAWVFLWA
jgi:hypothetical protein